MEERKALETKNFRLLATNFLVQFFFKIQWNFEILWEATFCDNAFVNQLRIQTLGCNKLKLTTK